MGGIFVSRESVVMMLAWAIMCVVFIPGIANWAHGAGLATGAAIGAASAFAARPRL